MIVYIFSAIYAALVIGTIPFFWRRRHLEPLRSREPRPAIGSAVFGAVFFILLGISDEFHMDNATYGNVSCMLTLWPASYIVPLWLTPYFARSFVLYYRYRLAVARAKGLSSKDQTWLYRHRWVTWRPLWAIVVVLSLIITTVIVGSLTFQVDGQSQDSFVFSTGCTGSYLYFILAQGILAILLCIVVIIAMLRVRDVYGFRTELIGVTVAAIVFLILWAVGQMTGKYPSGLPPTTFVYLLFISTFVISIVVPLGLTYHPFYRLATDSPDHTSIDLGTVHEKVPLYKISSNNLLDAVMRDADMLKGFKKFAASNFCSENIIFISDARRFSLFNDEHTRRTEAQRMVKLYFEHSSTLEINVDDEVVERIVTRAAANDFGADLFAEAEAKVAYILRTDTLAKWRSTTDFLETLEHSALSDFIDALAQRPVQRTLIRDAMRSSSKNRASNEALKSTSGASVKQQPLKSGGLSGEIQQKRDDATVVDMEMSMRPSHDTINSSKGLLDGDSPPASAQRSSEDLV